MHRIRQEQWLPINLEAAWEFFSDPRNLDEITPPDMHFEITSPVPEQMYTGMIITYTIRPMLNIPMNWCTEITHLREMAYFVDEQRQGPYRIWHHEHHFKAENGGTRMTDLLHYEIGKSVFGWLAGQLFVHRRVQQIFDHRFQALEQRFASPVNSPRP